jgi:hypothetical protein
VHNFANRHRSASTKYQLRVRGRALLDSRALHMHMVHMDVWRAATCGEGELISTNILICESSRRFYNHVDAELASLLTKIYFSNTFMESEAYILQIERESSILSSDVSLSAPKSLHSA